MRSFPFALALALAGCASIPSLTFEGDAAGGGEPANDGGDDASTAADSAAGQDGAIGADSAVSDGGAGDGADVGALTCPSVIPPLGLDSCCSATGCLDLQHENNCKQCGDCLQLNCAIGEICCYRPNGNLNCRKTIADCK